MPIQEVQKAANNAYTIPFILPYPYILRIDLRKFLIINSIIRDSYAFLSIIFFFFV